MKSINRILFAIIFLFSTLIANTFAQKSFPNNSDLKSVFNNYFLVKDALVKSDGNAVSAQAKDLLIAIGFVEMDNLTEEEHTIWMKQIKDISMDAKQIADSKNIGSQRNHFITLSKSMFQLIKVSKQETPVYYQFCPMANQGKGANWLSKESAVKNPYYGNQMLTCGRTIETIK